MATEELKLPLIDISGYVSPKSPEDKQRVIEEVSQAARKYGFFQIKGHGIPLGLQQDLVKCMTNVFDLPYEEKMKMSFLNNPCRRGYEASGMSHRPGDTLPDAKECFFVGRDDPNIELAGIFGPNIWPSLPASSFSDPITQYYDLTSVLGKTLWSILLEGLSQPPETVEKFSKRPIVPMKMIRYPPATTVQAGQYGIGAHTDFGGVTILFQQPGKDGLEVWVEDRQAWIEVPALEDVYVINCGDMIQRWSDGVYKSAKHRVINKVENGERMSCATFWHGDVRATNPLNPLDKDRETVGMLLAKRLGGQYSFSDELLAEIGAAA
ncbi:2OG-Fe II oxygenase [Pyrenophora tritici-repentis]|uniref:2OG-Fe oxygenase n=2 Tax=Pyrenophora tritici-repentis TaxID=45151 RepID=A0A2W1GEC4_9PLEO|nr:2OG-Fe(II) oxygenase [Pyrenophora tritici-repentis Pt-1C-BFP]KAA8619669.1 2OG-Fe(II) oxygenase [Pyrenophora tritici-repentis]EDU47081.1 2OG-Fe(II) oxygenase [Pyrenophora tritici-repentis Pt-1C-BFP]KAF7447809.1 2OG-Fe oxygenase [Pyrenophora tritici-repentis]KAF7571511.1 2OG-Fe(II) oxygenase [Pyrenophora tritici-repentis]KAG9385264.1 2OG-Fe oxygenase [Pyrenophora tritici-repentis]